MRQTLGQSRQRTYDLDDRNCLNGKEQCLLDAQGIGCDISFSKFRGSRSKSGQWKVWTLERIYRQTSHAREDSLLSYDNELHADDNELHAEVL